MAEVKNESNKIAPQRPVPPVRKMPARAPKKPPVSPEKPPKAPANSSASKSVVDKAPKKEPFTKQAPAKKPLTAKVPARPQQVPVQTATVENKNLNVVEKALSIEELNARKQRRIRNWTYALSVIATLLIVILILIIFWPPPKSVEAIYDFSLNGVPSVTKVQHVIRSDEADGNVVVFKEPISIKTSESSSQFVSIIIQPTFKAEGLDITSDIYLQLVYNNSEDIYNVDNIRSATVGSLENVSAYQIYVDLNENKYIYFTNVLTASDGSYPLILGFMAKDRADLEKEITMDINIYGVNAESIELINTVTGSYVRVGNEISIPADSEWLTEVQENLIQKKN